jgi:hypothetical protein
MGREGAELTELMFPDEQGDKSKTEGNLKLFTIIQVHLSSATISPAVFLPVLGLRNSH